MSPSGRLWLIGLGLVATLVVGGLVARRSPEPPVYWAAPAFALVDHEGDSLRSGDIAGTAWIASFVFTHCTSVCPVITRTMAGLRDSLEAHQLLGRRIRLLSFSLDPVRDTPEVLRKYAGEFGGSPPGEWAFLTGGQPEATLRLVSQGFHLAVQPLPATPADSESGYQIMHSTRLVLVDGEGQIRGLYQANEPEAMERLATDLRRVLK